LTDLINKVGTIAAVAIFVALAAEFLARVFLFNETILTETGAPLLFGFNAATAEWFLLFFIIAVTIVVVAVPEGLPMAVNVSLALSMRKIQADNNLVRKMLATETIGAANVILTDKTGTLTENKMTVTQIYLAGQQFTDGEVAKLQNHPLYKLLELNAAVNSTAHLITKDGRTVPDGNSTEGALLSWVAAQGTDYRRLRETVGLLKRIPFDAEIKRMSSVVRSNGRLIVLVKGAPERVLPLCSSIETGNGTEPIDENGAAVQAELDHQTSQAIRTLALAYKILPDNASADDDPESDLTLLALVGIADPMRKDVPEAIQIARGAGIEVKMVTGDNMQTATVLAERLGMLDQDSLVMEGEEFRRLEDSEAEGILKRLRVLARAEPLDKRRLVKLLQGKRQVVAVTGDGTNDALALKDADVGLSMGLSGTEVAKEASDIVLLDDNFYSIVKAVHWGRALYENIQKFLQFQLTINLSALLTAFLSPLLNLFLEPLLGIHLLEIPLTVVQLLWVNLIMDTLAVLALCLESPVTETMQRKPVGREEEIITPVMKQNILGMGLYFTLILLVLMATNFFGADRVSREFSSVVFTTYVFFQVFNLFNARALHITRSPFAGLSLSSNFVRVMILIVVIQILLTAFGGEVFNTAPLPLGMWVRIILLTSTALIFGEIVRRIRLSRMRAERGALQPVSVSQ
jgi:Ca2+-transporting ATPase